MQIDPVECAELAIEFIEKIKDVKLTTHQIYFIGREIEKRSGAYYEIPSKLGEKL